MAFTGLGPEVNLPALRPRPRAKFTDVAVEVDLDSMGADRTPMGATYMTMGALSPIIADYTCSSEDVKTGNLTLEARIQPAFLMFNLLECSTLSGDLEPLRSYTQGAFDLTVSEALAHGATSAVSASHLNLLANSTPISGGTGAIETLASVEQALAERISNAQGVIFISPRYLTPYFAAGALYIDGDQIITAAGHRVISDAGHNGLSTIYATGALGYSVTASQDLGDIDEFDRTRNIVLWLRERYALILFNPAHTVRSVIAGAVS